MSCAQAAVRETPADRLNTPRPRAERWTDRLVGYLAALEDVSEFAFEPQRAKEFARDLRCQCGEPGSRQVWPLVLASLRAAFTQGLERKVEKTLASPPPEEPFPADPERAQGLR